MSDPPYDQYDPEGSGYQAEWKKAHENPDGPDTQDHILFIGDNIGTVDLTALADNPCPVRSSVTDRGCLLPAGHPPFRADRFHRYRPDPTHRRQL